MSSGVLRKKKVFTLCRPIPAFIPRQIALDVLRDHSEIINLNPLVTGHARINPPPHAAKDELKCFWYEIQERIQYIPGTGSLGSGSIKFTGCFHDLPWGLQTHIYAPMSVDLRCQYRVAGHLPGVEPDGPRELGMEELGAPAEGLYLRTDIEFSSNVALAGFVRAQLKEAIKTMVDRITERAEKLDAEVLQNMLKDEKLQSPVEPSQQTQSFSRYPSMANSTSKQQSFTRVEEQYLRQPSPQPRRYSNTSPLPVQNNIPPRQPSPQPGQYNGPSYQPSPQPGQYTGPPRQPSPQPAQYNAPPRQPSPQPHQYNNAPRQPSPQPNQYDSRPAQSLPYPDSTPQQGQYNNHPSQPTQYNAYPPQRAELGASTLHPNGNYYQQRAPVELEDNGPVANAAPYYNKRSSGYISPEEKAWAESRAAQSHRWSSYEGNPAPQSAGKY